jgi:hypothetical protein
VASMGIFRRPRETPPRAAIAGFWAWWPTVRQRLETALADQPPPPRLLEEIADQVRTMHPELDCEIGPGLRLTHSFTVTGGGRGELRGITERWRRAAPEESEWEFHAARQPRPEHLDQTISLDDHELDLSHVALGLRADMSKARVHVTAYHPDFLFLPDEARATIASQVLDWALGEDDVGRWVGEIVAAADKPMDALPASALPSVVEQIAAAHAERGWLTGEGRTARGHPARIAVRFPLHRQDHPLCELHVAVSVPYAHSNPDRLPVNPSAAALREFAGGFAVLGEDAVLAAHETGDGRRVFHLYADPETGVVARLDQITAEWPEGRARVVTEPDPGWEALGPYLR